MSDFSAKILDASRAAVRTVFGIDPDDRQLMVETPKDPKMGDYSTSVAMRLAKTLHKSPMQIADLLVKKKKKRLPGSLASSTSGLQNLRFLTASIKSSRQEIIMVIMKPARERKFS